MEKMHYRRMDEGTDEDFAVLRHVHEQTLRAVPDRLFAMLGDLKQDTAYNITRYDHCLQAATRAFATTGTTIRRRGAAVRRREPLARTTTAKSSLRSCAPSSAATITRCWCSTACSRPISTPGTWASIPTRRRLQIIRRMSRRSSSAPNTTRYPSNPTTRTSRDRPSSRSSVGCLEKMDRPVADAVDLISCAGERHDPIRPPDWDRQGPPTIDRMEQMIVRGAFPTRRGDYLN